MTPKLTGDGKNLLLRALLGDRINFTKIRFGNGPEQDPEKAEDLINPLITSEITSITLGESYVTLTATFTNATLQNGFRITEIGFYAMNPEKEDEEILYAIGNENESSADYVPDGTSRIFEMQFDALVFVGSAENVTAAISSSLVYATKTAFDSHVDNHTNPHQVTKEQLGLGNVPNVTTNDHTPTFEEAKKLENIESGEKLSIIFGKIKLAITRLFKHLEDKNNPHGVTAEQISAAPKSHTHSTTDINSGALAPQRGGTGVSNPKAGGLLKAKGAEACESLLGVGALYSEESGNPIFGTLPVTMGGTGVTSLESLSEQLSGSLIVVGEYTGNNQTYREISLGFYPRAVLLFDSNGRTTEKYRTAVEDQCVYYGGLALRGSPIKYTYNSANRTVLAVTQNGFAVGYDDSSVGTNETRMVYTNRSDLSYRYIALR